MMRQYIAFAAVIFIAIFIISQLEWGALSVSNFRHTNGGQRLETDEGINSANREIDFRDLSVGSVSGTSRRQNPKPAFSAPETVNQTAAATSSPVTATSTPFQAGREAQSTYHGVNIQFSNPQ